MKIEIIRNGVFTGPDASHQPIGTVIEVPDGFTGWPGKWRPVEDAAPAPAAEPDAWDDGDDDEEAVRARYEVVFGKKPHGNATVKSMLAAIAKELGE